MRKEQGDALLSQTLKKPLAVLQKSVNKQVSVRLKSDYEYHGRMANVDPYMNIILSDASEYNSGNLLANFGRVVIRGNNILFIKIENEI